MLTLVADNSTDETEGVVEGVLAASPHGTIGSWSDPIFIPEAFSCTYEKLNTEDTA
jgi:inosine/xanthosine triphosphate pyrophosphatase family protein